MQRKILAGVLASTALLLGTAGCSSTGNQVAAQNSVISAAQQPLSENYFTPVAEYDSLEALMEEGQTIIHSPETIGDSDSRVYYTFSDESCGLVEVVYSKDGTETVQIRRGDPTVDLTGDSTEYSYETIDTEQSVDYTMKGEAGTVYLVTWTAISYTDPTGTFGYAISFFDGTTEEEALAVATEVR